jgi:integrase
MLSSRTSPSRLRGVAILGYWTGMRRGEILGDPRLGRPGLQWRRVDRKALEIRLDPGTTKNGDGRTIPYGDVQELRDMIDAQWKAHEKLLAKGIISNLVFPRLRGKKNPGRPIIDFRKAWNVACAKAGVPGRRFHDFRRTAVRDLTRARVPRQVAMQITGHKTESVFNRYDIVDTNDRREAMRKRAAAG